MHMRWIYVWLPGAASSTQLPGAAEGDGRGEGFGLFFWGKNECRSASVHTDRQRTEGAEGSESSTVQTKTKNLRSGAIVQINAVEDSPWGKCVVSGLGSDDPDQCGGRTCSTKTIMKKKNLSKQNKPEWTALFQSIFQVFHLLRKLPCATYNLSNMNEYSNTHIHFVP